MKLYRIHPGLPLQHNWEVPPAGLFTAAELTTFFESRGPSEVPLYVETIEIPQPIHHLMGAGPGHAEAPCFYCSGPGPLVRGLCRECLAEAIQEALNG